MIIGENLRKILGTQSQLDAQVFPETLFITGCMRSGTTFLANKLTQHPQLLKIGGELNDIWTDIGGAPIFPINESRSRKDASYEYSNNMTHYFSRNLAEAKSMKRHFLRYIYKQKTGGGRVSYDWDGVRVVNKSPHFCNKMSYVNELFPKSKIIFIVRSIHAQSASLKMHFISSKTPRAMPAEKGQGWLGPGLENSHKCLGIYPPDFKVIPEMWLRLNEIAMKDVNDIPREKIAIVKYEDMVDKQDEVLRALFSFLDLKAEHKSEQERIINSGIKVFNTSTKGNPINKWEKHLTESEKSILEDVIRENHQSYQSTLELIEEYSII